MKTITSSTLRKEIATLLTEVAEKKETIVITRQNGLPAVLLSYDEYLEFKQFKERKRG